MDSLLFTTYDQNKINELQDKLNQLSLPIKVVGLAEVDYAPQKSYSEATLRPELSDNVGKLVNSAKRCAVALALLKNVAYIIRKLRSKC